MRVPWDDVYGRPVLEFLNVLCYLKDKREQEKRDRDKMMQQIK